MDIKPFSCSTLGHWDSSHHPQKETGIQPTCYSQVQCACLLHFSKPISIATRKPTTSQLIWTNPLLKPRRSFNDSLNGISDPPLLLERQLLKVTSTSSPTLRLENNIFAPWLMWLKPQQVMEHMMVNERFPW